MSGDTVFQNHYLRTMKRPHTNLMDIFLTTNNMNAHSHTDVFLNTNFTNNTNKGYFPKTLRHALAQCEGLRRYGALAVPFIHA